MYAAIIHSGLCRGNTSHQIAEKTTLGRILSGGIIEGHWNAISLLSFHTQFDIDSIHRGF